jgi:hypothetical protein
MAMSSLCVYTLCELSFVCVVDTYCVLLCVAHPTIGEDLQLYRPTDRTPRYSGSRLDLEVQPPHDSRTVLFVVVSIVHGEIYTDFSSGSALVLVCKSLVHIILLY